MKTEDLLNLGNYQKLDFVLIGGTASRTDGIARLRAPTREERRSGLGVRLTVESAQTRTYRRPLMSHQELGAALAGCRRMPYLAAFYHARGDYSVYEKLKRGLMLEVMRLINSKQWPTRLSRLDGSHEHYQGELAELVLDFDAHIPLFTKMPWLFETCLGISDDVWDKTVRHWYRELADRYERWIAEAKAHVGRRWTTDDADEPLAKIPAAAAPKGTALDDLPIWDNADGIRALSPVKIAAEFERLKRELSIAHQRLAAETVAA